MFQTFDAPTSPDQGPPRLAALRAEIAREGLDGFLVPRADRHQGEYVAPCDERLAWLTGFTGSAGFCAALRDRAGLFVDGRYRVQVKAQVADDFTPVDWPETKLGDWLKGALPEGGRVGFDPWLHTLDEITRTEGRLQGTGIELVECDNLVDRIWTDRPPRPAAPVEKYPKELAGDGDETKRERIAAALRAAGQKAAVLTLPDSLCWLLNIRGADIPRTPVTQAFAILHDDGRMQLFSDPEKFEGLGPDPMIAQSHWDGFAGALAVLDGPVRVDKGTAPLAVTRILERAGVEVAHDDDPCILPKACKSDTEIAATRTAHLRDAAAMCEFLAWLDAEAPTGGLTEIDVVTALEGYRRATNALREISFDTICGAGPNGAIVHYRVTEETNRAVKPGELLLVDSGGQYLDGTTDITRTVAIGTPTEEQRACFTRVLKGMIAISRARWPEGRAGRDLDALARIALWRAGQDYDHSTGHGVGVYLSVHEGPQRLSRVSEVPLKPGMILSNEPGYYREGAFGIRIENLVVVQTAGTLPGADDRAMLDFETLTWVPIDRALVVPEMLDAEERAWLDAYHAEIRAKLADRLSPGARDWLERATRAI
ncbi:aminopeptidase P family protein [Psychromarinibacter sp. C21-152]|uniref:Aminopeptidase P family protein n=1 Tax=Psychromarinibacter sediminicola TaxID=3033385 RepID=A0AAE3NQC7_9RHOB|nr:aminopeptidase P family protein [Psychromarinibacter sediminicola]MDF0600106.1 aminopeptidase P family protein [Psychromarinibacter sediminicola]